MALVAELNRERLLGVEHEFSAVCVGNGTGIDVQRSIAEVFRERHFFHRSRLRPFRVLTGHRRRI